jgi:hypothetical protein
MMFGFGASEKNKPEQFDDLTAVRAGECLITNEFKAYRDAYEREEAEIIGTLINEAAMFVVGDAGTIEKFGAKCLIRLNRLRDLRSLLVKVTVDSRRGGK